MACREGERGGIIFKFLLLLCFLGFLFVIYLLRYPLLRLAGGFWVVDDGPAYSDVIVVLSDDNYGGDRAAGAAKLFVKWAGLRACWRAAASCAPTLLSPS